MEMRRKPKPTWSSRYRPESSGPRWAMLCAIRARITGPGFRPARPSMAARPHLFCARGSPSSKTDLCRLPRGCCGGPAAGRHHVPVPGPVAVDQVVLGLGMGDRRGGEEILLDAVAVRVRRRAVVVDDVVVDDRTVVRQRERAVAVVIAHHDAA